MRERRKFIALLFRLEHGGEGIATALADHDNDLALAALIASKATVAAILAEIGGLHVAAEIATIDFRDLAFAADNAALQFSGHRFADFVQQHESGLVERPRSRERASATLALNLVTEDCDGRKIHFNGSLWLANSVPDVTLKCVLHSRHSKQGAPVSRRYS